MTIIVGPSVKNIDIFIDDAASDEELTFHVEADADMAIINVEDIKTED